METARAFWKLQDLMDEIVSRVVNTGDPPIVVIDAMAERGDLRVRPEDEWTIRREGIRSLVNDHAGMRGLRSGKVQSSGSRLRVLDEHGDALAARDDIILARLVFEGADGSMRSVLEFSHDDAEAAYGRRVRAPREQADREEPFWLAVMDATSIGRTPKRRSADVRAKLARLAVESGLTVGADVIPESDKSRGAAD